MYRETNGNKTGDVAKEEEHTLAINQNIREEPRKAPIKTGFEQDFKYFAMVHIGSIWIYVQQHIGTSVCVLQWHVPKLIEVSKTLCVFCFTQLYTHIVLYML